MPKTEPLTLTAPTIIAAQRLSRLLTVNALALAVLHDKREMVETAARPAPFTNSKPKAGLSTADYLRDFYAEREAFTAMRDAAQAVLDAERYMPQNVQAALLGRHRAEQAHARAECRVRETMNALRSERSPHAPPGHLTRYEFKLPTVHYVHPIYGLHALSEPLDKIRVDTAGLYGDDLAVFLTFMREFPARGVWPLYAPDARDGLQKTKNHRLATPARLIFERLILAHPGSVPTVHPAEVAREVLQTA